jgi:hypothetical protein
MAARTRYAPDRGLTVRMTATMFLLGLVFVAFVAAIIGIGTATHASDAAIVLFAVVLGGGFAIGSLFYSDKIALRTAGAARSPRSRRLSCTASWTGCARWRTCQAAGGHRQTPPCRTPSRPGATPTTRCSA